MIGARVTLNGINRVGLVGWKRREWWIQRDVRIWSDEWRLYWRPDAQGYTTDPGQAWIVDFPTAFARTQHCGPEKRIVYEAAGRTTDAGLGSAVREITP